MTTEVSGVAPARADGGSHLWLERWTALFMVLVPLLGTVAAVVLLWGWAVGVTEVVLLAVMYALTTFGIHTGFHRMASHRAFHGVTAVRVAYAICGSMAGQGSVYHWAAIHRRHHKYSDQPGDPHTPHLHGRGVWGLVKGFWHVHAGWLLSLHQIRDRGAWIPDLLRDRALFRVNELYFLWVFLGLAAPAAVGGLVYALAGESPWWVGALLGFLWGGLVRMFLQHHSTWTVNSLCHLWGGRPYPSRHDQSRNNVLGSLLTLGDGWHNNHHAFPTAAYNDFRWWQIDLNAWLIRGLRSCGLVWDVKCPSNEALAKAQRWAVQGAAPGPEDAPPATDEGRPL